MLQVKKKIGTEFSTSISKNETETELSFKIYGGSSEGITESNIGDKFISWSKSINEDNARSIGVANNGIIYLPNLVRCIDEDLANTLDEHITMRASKAYDELVSKFKTSEPDKPYEISNAKELYQSLNKSDENSNYILANDIDLDNFNWIPVKSFNGNLDGNGHTIKNLTIDQTGNIDDNIVSVGFVQNNKGTLKNIVFEKIKINATHRYDTSYETRIRGGLVGFNGGSIINVQVVDSQFNLCLTQENDRSGHDAYPTLDLGGIAGWNEGNIEYCTIRNTTLQGYSDGKNNKGIFYSVVGGLVGTNRSKISNCVSTKLTIESSARGGWHKTASGWSGDTHSWSGYLTGNNEGSISNSIIYNQTSIISKAEALNNYKAKIEAYWGLVSGNNLNSGTFDNVFAMASENLSYFLGNNSKTYSEYVKTTKEELARIVTLWANWKYDNGEFYITK